MILEKVKSYLFRNRQGLSGVPYRKGIVNYEYWNLTDNLGDSLSYVVYHWMLARKNLTPESKAKKTCHLMGIGSIVAEKQFDSVIWGSGIHTLAKLYKLFKWRKVVKYDIRALRGPITQTMMLKSGYDCTDIVYGDPAVLMPKIYMPESSPKKYDVSVINHFSIQSEQEGTLHQINIQTKDYRYFIDEIVASKFVISSSLHGIILAESYGVPAIFLNEQGKMYPEIIKYFDWYLSTGRNHIQIAGSMEEALQMKPLELPDLSTMQNQLLDSFPYDLWE